MGKGGGAVAPTTQTFSYATISKGLAGPIDATSIVGRTNLLANQLTPLVLYVKGTDASIKMFNPNGYGTGSGLVGVSVDGGAVTLPVGAANKFPLFAGLSDTVHKVVITVGAGFGSNSYYVNNGSDPLEVTGTSPSVTTSAVLVQRGQADNAKWSSITKAQVSPRLPTPMVFVSSVASTSSIPMVRFVSSSAYIDINTSAAWVGVAVDGVTSYYNLAGTQAKSAALRIPTDGLSHTYSLWCNQTANGLDAHWPFTIGLDSAPTTLSTQKQFHQYGDSITWGMGSTSTAHTDLMRAAASIGVLGSTYGKSGQTSAQLVTNCVTQAAEAGGNVGTDIAVVAIGRNDIPTFTSADFDSIAATLLGYYAKVLFRDVLDTVVNPSVQANVTTFNNALAAWVTSKADARIILIPTASWSGIVAPDGTHPSDAGYVTLAGYAATAYAPYV